MGLHKPFDRHMITNEGAVKLSGGANRLPAGSFAIVDMDAPPTSQGLKILSDFSGVSKKRKIELKLGKPKVAPKNSRFLDNFPFSSVPFKIEDIVSLKVDAPDGKGDQVDDFIVGYNGQAGSELSFQNGDNEPLHLILSGAAMEYAGYQKGMATVQVLFDAPNEGTKNTTGVATANEWTDQEVVENAIERLKNYRLIGDQELSRYVDIIPVNSLNPASVPGTTQNFYSLELEDDGTLTQLARVQAQYPSLDIKREILSEGLTKYVTIATSLPSAYSKSKKDLLKGCADCPSGYTAVEQGFVYQIEIEDNGTDVSDSIIEAEIPGATADTAVRNGGNSAGTGFYTVVTDDALTESEISTFVTANPTAIVEKIADDVVDLCTNATTVDTAWVQGETCTAQTEVYTIVVPEDECGVGQFDAVQAAYPDLVIQEGNPTETNATVTLSGTSGTATLTIGTSTYTITFDTDLATTVSGFITAEAASILEDTGFTATGNSNRISLTNANAPVGSVNISIANATGDLAGTVGTQTGNEDNINFACQSQMFTLVTTNLVCEECDPIFRDLFSSEAPHDFNLIPWKKLDKQYNGLAKMGIRFRAKRTILAPSENFRDDVASLYDSVKLRLAGGFPTMINENYRTGENGRFSVKLLSRYKPATHLGMHLRCYEDMSRIWFDNTWRHVGNNYAKFVYGEETLLKATAQYVDYAITIHKRRYAQAASDKVDEGTTYHIIAEFGRHQEIENLLNKLAAAAGVEAVQASAKS